MSESNGAYGSYGTGAGASNRVRRKKKKAKRKVKHNGTNNERNDMFPSVLMSKRQPQPSVLVGSNKFGGPPQDVLSNMDTFESVPPPVKSTRKGKHPKLEPIQTNLDEIDVSTAPVSSRAVANVAGVYNPNKAVPKSDRKGIKMKRNGEDKLKGKIAIDSALFIRDDEERKVVRSEKCLGFCILLCCLVLIGSLVGGGVYLQGEQDGQARSVGSETTLTPTTMFPTESPTQFPTMFPTKDPTPFPTMFPTDSPTPFPTMFPTKTPTLFPTTASPTSFPTTASPTKFPTTSPTLYPTSFPTTSPTPFPTTAAPTPFPN